MLAAVPARLHCLLLTVAVTGVLACLPAVAQEAAATAPPASATVQAGRWLAAGRAEEAWSLLAPLEPTRQGDSEFDYLLALAALDSSRPASALAPLRRILGLEPRFDGARLDLARALAATGDAAGARLEYGTVLERSPAESARASARAGLAALDGPGPDGAVAGRVVATTPSGSRAVRWIPALLIGAGYDSNANVSSSDSVFGFTLDPRAVQQASSFAEVGATLRGEGAPTPQVGLVSMLRAGHRINPDARFVDLSTADLGLGLNARIGSWTAGLGANLATGWLDGEAYFHSAFVEATLARPLSASWELVGAARAIGLDYLPSRFAPLDVRRYVWGAALQRRISAAGIPQFGMALLGGRDAARNATSPWSNDRYGVRLFGSRAIGQRGAVFGELAWLTSDFFGARGFFGADRLDRQAVAALGVELRGRPWARWQIAPQLRYTDNRSNVYLYRFERFEASVFLRREFD